jgi:hypothetical protein
MSPAPTQRFSITEDVNGFPVSVSGEDNGQAIVIYKGRHEFLVVGFRVSVSFTDPAFQWPTMKTIHVARVDWNHERWNGDGEPEYHVDQSHKTLSIDLDRPQALQISW